jgi:hypothetical protein
MSLMKTKVYMIFYGRRGKHWLHNVLDLYRWIAGRPAAIEHCAVNLKPDNNKDLIYHVGWRQNSRWLNHKAYQKLGFKELDIIYLGEREISDKKCLENIKTVRFGLFIYFFWYLLIRHISKWKPRNNCAAKSAEILQMLGYNVEETPIPIWLWDQLKEGEYDANDSNCRKGRIRKDHFG